MTGTIKVQTVKSTVEWAVLEGVLSKHTEMLVKRKQKKKCKGPNSSRNHSSVERLKGGKPSHHKDVKQSLNGREQDYVVTGNKKRSALQEERDEGGGKKKNGLIGISKQIKTDFACSN